MDKISEMKIYHFLIFVLFVSTLYSGFQYRLPIVLISLFNLFYTHKTIEKLSVSLYALIFLGFSYTAYYSLANHYFLLGIFSLYLSYKLWFNDRSWNYPFYILALVISVATLQKLGSTYFLEGNLIGQLLLNGTGLSIVGHLLDPEYTLHSEAFFDGYGNMPYEGRQVKIETTDSMIDFAVFFTWAIVLSEILLSLAVIFLKTRWKYISLLVFLILTSITRSEFGFFSILITISLFDTNFKDIKLRRWYKLLFPLFIICYCWVHSERVIWFFENKL